MINNRELLRKLIHLSNLIIPFTYLFYFNSKIEALMVLGPITSFAIIIEYLRINSVIVKKIFDSFGHFVSRLIFFVTKVKVHKLHFVLHKMRGSFLELIFVTFEG